MNSNFIASGSFLPPKIVTNDDLSKTLDTSDEWIFPRTGVKQRRIVENETTADLATKACENALKKTGWSAESVDLIILATSTPDMDFPATASIVQRELGAINAVSFDIQAVCSGFVYALSTADLYLKAGKAKRALVIGAERMSAIVDWTDRATCVLFGDGAGAFALEAQDNNSGILDSILYTDGRQADILCAGTPEHAKAYMNGREVFRHAVSKMADVSKEILAKNNLSVADVDYFIPHQANMRIIKSVGEAVGFSTDQVISTVRNHANTSAGSIPLAFDEALSGKVKKGDLVLMTALGAGLTWGATLLRI